MSDKNLPRDSPRSFNDTRNSVYSNRVPNLREIQAAIEEHQRRVEARTRINSVENPSEWGIEISDSSGSDTDEEIVIIPNNASQSHHNISVPSLSNIHSPTSANSGGPLLNITSPSSITVSMHDYGGNNPFPFNEIEMESVDQTSPGILRRSEQMEDGKWIHEADHVPMDEYHGGVDKPEFNPHIAHLEISNMTSMGEKSLSTDHPIPSCPVIENEVVSQDYSQNYRLLKYQQMIEREERYELLKDKHKLREYIRRYTIQTNTAEEESKSNSKILTFIRKSWNTAKRYLGGRKYMVFLNKIRPFKSTVRLVEKNFGSGIASFYEFFVSIIYMNIVTFVIMFLLLILPWFIGFRGWNNWTVDFLSGIIGLDGSIIGYYSWFFYGAYPASFSYLFGKLHWSFTFFHPMAIICYFIVSLIIIVHAIGKRLRRVSSLVGTSYFYVNCVFNMWDHNTSEEKSVDQMKRSIANMLKERLKHDELLEKRSKKKSKKELVILIIRRIVGVVMSLILIIGAPVAVGFVAYYYDEINTKFAYTTSIITSAINAVFPLVLKFLVYLEDYESMATTNNNIILRIFFVKMSTTVALMIRVLYPNKLIKQTNVVKPNKCIANEAGLLFWQMLLIDFVLSWLFTVVGTFVFYQGMRLFVKEDEDEEVVYRLKQKTAVETIKKQGIFAVSTQEGVTEAIQTIVDNTSASENEESKGVRRRRWFRRNSEGSKIQIETKRRSAHTKALLEFEIHTNVIELMYRQSIIWIGSIMSPMIPLLGVLSSVILFYTKYFTMMLMCKFPTNPEIDGRSSPYNHLLLFITMILSIVPAVVFLLRTADECGPHMNSERLTPLDMMARSWNNNVVFKNVDNLRKYWYLATFYVFHPITLAITTIIMALLSYFLFMRLQMFRTRMVTAEADAKLERDDKQFLIDKYGVL